jgi:SAM-dependent methyltransferase
MELADWDERHRVADRDRRASVPVGAIAQPRPAELVRETAGTLTPGRALDLACGRGESGLWLAQRGWQVTAVDRSAAAIKILQSDALALGLAVVAQIADLEGPDFAIAPRKWNLILIQNYFQPDLYRRAVAGLATGGILIASALLAVPGKHRFRVESGQFAKYFTELEIIQAKETNGAHPIAEIVARRNAI